MKFRERPMWNLALAGVLIAALGLAACGRKGPLEPPPGASVVGEPSGRNVPGEPAPAVGVFGEPIAVEEAAPSPKAPNRRLPIDVLLN